MMQRFSEGGAVDGDDQMSSLSRLLGGIDVDSEGLDPSVKMVLQSI